MWTKRRSQNAVAAKRRRRERDVTEELEWPSAHTYQPPRPWARLTLQIRDHRLGDSLTLKLYATPFANQWSTGSGQFSSAHLAKTVRLILQSAGGKS